jgi:hypothetical protein
VVERQSYASDGGLDCASSSSSASGELYVTQRHNIVHIMTPSTTAERTKLDSVLESGIGDYFVASTPTKHVNKLRDGMEVGM